MILAQKLTEYKQKLIEYANLIENMLDKSLKGLIYREQTWLLDIIENDEPKANNFEIELESIGTILIAQYGPVAKDLRTILMVLKINNDLERIGDHIVNITESSQFLIAQPRIKPLANIAKMGDGAIKMLRDSINAFIQENTELANQVCVEDSTIDELMKQVIRELIPLMSASPRTIETSLHLIRVAHNLERIADLSINISEDVIFLVEGRAVKHRHI
uniref:Phosphate-specific transport system accessory protein PhoU n=1 Tax=candidate division WOR-3 bacterium TaxID=2052148 RepID=A0A7C6A886_UNCW3